ncbi:hypothetical protein FNF27_06105 [Cafeteria roenbergensis]|uniref:Guanylate cyclase domain-containing protein n=1 Tax=Cafeteria roenbergensis TaxID=33653 RepID=A0A5A8E3C9_CAFRO|nr:hypothetical protein FNF27_06105 [Cafeteria roenbergensis]
MSGVVAAAKAVLGFPFAVFRLFLESFPAVRTWASWFLWYPTIAFNRTVYVLLPAWRPMFSLVDAEHRLLLGAVPLFESDVQFLHSSHRVSAVLNMCSEWEDHLPLYASLGIRYHREKVVDFTVPARLQLLRCAQFIEECVAEGRTIYCHCKAGKGRSTCALLAWYMVFQGLAPERAWAALRVHRPHISKKHLTEGIQAFWAEVLSGAITPDSVRAGAWPGKRSALSASAADARRPLGLGRSAPSARGQGARPLGSGPMDQDERRPLIAEPAAGSARKAAENRPAAAVHDEELHGAADSKRAPSAEGGPELGWQQQQQHAEPDPRAAYHGAGDADLQGPDGAEEGDLAGLDEPEHVEHDLMLEDPGVTIWEEFQEKRDLKAAPSLANSFLILALTLSALWLAMLPARPLPWKHFFIEPFGAPVLLGCIVSYGAALYVASKKCAHSRFWRPLRLRFGRVASAFAGLGAGAMFMSYAFSIQLTAWAMDLDLDQAYALAAGLRAPDPTNEAQVAWAGDLTTFFVLRSRSNVFSPHTLAVLLGIPMLVRPLMLRQVDFVIFLVCLALVCLAGVIVRLYLIAPKWRLKFQQNDPWLDDSDSGVFAIVHLALVFVVTLGLSYRLVSQREDQAWGGFVQRKRLQLQAIRAEELLTLAMPRQIAHRLMAGELEQRHYKSASVGFIYIAGYKDLVYEANDDLLGLVDDLHQLYCRFDALVLQHDSVYKIESVANCYMVAAGIPDEAEDHAPALLRFCLAALELCRHLRRADPDIDWRLKIGIHSGSVTSGVVGLSRTFFRLFGDTVNTASRMGTRGEADRVHISASTYRLVGTPPVINPQVEGDDEVLVGEGGEEMGRHFVFGKVENTLELLVLPPEEVLFDLRPDGSEFGDDSESEAGLPLLGYTVEARGEIPVKGKGMMRTYFVDLPPSIWGDEDDDLYSQSDYTRSGPSDAGADSARGSPDDVTARPVMAGAREGSLADQLVPRQPPALGLAAQPTASDDRDSKQRSISGDSRTGLHHTVGASDMADSSVASVSSEARGSSRASQRRMSSAQYPAKSIRRVTSRPRQQLESPSAPRSAAVQDATAPMQDSLGSVSQIRSLAARALAHSGAGSPGKSPPSSPAGAYLGLALGPTIAALSAVSKMRRRRASQSTQSRRGRADAPAYGQVSGRGVMGPGTPLQSPQAPFASSEAGRATHDLTLDINELSGQTSTRRLLAAASMRRPKYHRSSSTPRRDTREGFAPSLEQSRRSLSKDAAEGPFFPSRGDAGLLSGPPEDDDWDATDKAGRRASVAGGGPPVQGLNSDGTSFVPRRSSLIQQGTLAGEPLRPSASFAVTSTLDRQGAGRGGGLDSGSRPEGRAGDDRATIISASTGARVRGMGSMEPEEDSRLAGNTDVTDASPTQRARVLRGLGSADRSQDLDAGSHSHHGRSISPERGQVGLRSDTFSSSGPEQRTSRAHEGSGRDTAASQDPIRTGSARAKFAAGFDARAALGKSDTELSSQLGDGPGAAAQAGDAHAAELTGDLGATAGSLAAAARRGDPRALWARRNSDGGALLTSLQVDTALQAARQLLSVPSGDGLVDVTSGRTDDADGQHGVQGGDASGRAGRGSASGNAPFHELGPRSPLHRRAIIEARAKATAKSAAQGDGPLGAQPRTAMVVDRPRRQSEGSITQSRATSIHSGRGLGSDHTVESQPGAAASTASRAEEDRTALPTASSPPLSDAQDMAPAFVIGAKAGPGIVSPKQQPARPVAAVVAPRMGEIRKRGDAARRLSQQRLEEAKRQLESAKIAHTRAVLSGREVVIQEALAAAQAAEAALLAAEQELANAGTFSSSAPQMGPDGRVVRSPDSGSRHSEPKDAPAAVQIAAAAARARHMRRRRSSAVVQSLGVEVADALDTARAIGALGQLSRLASQDSTIPGSEGTTVAPSRASHLDRAGRPERAARAERARIHVLQRPGKHHSGKRRAIPLGSSSTGRSASEGKDDKATAGHPSAPLGSPSDMTAAGLASNNSADPTGFASDALGSGEHDPNASPPASAASQAVFGSRGRAGRATGGRSGSGREDSAGRPRWGTLSGRGSKGAAGLVASDRQLGGSESSVGNGRSSSTSSSGGSSEEGADV